MKTPIKENAKHQYFALTFGLFLVISLSGCVSPQATVESANELNKYRKIYIGIPEEDPRGVYPRIISRLKLCDFDVVEVSADGKGGGSQGTGFVVSEKGHLLTCEHVVRHYDFATVWIEGKRHSAKVIATDTNLDVALLKISDNSNFKPLTFDTSLTYRMGQEVYSMGFPLVEILGTSPRLNKGLISSTVGMEDNAEQIQVSAEVQPGNSGGPLLDVHGNVAGLVISTLNPLNVLARSGGNLPQNVNFAVKTQPLIEFLSKSGVQVSNSPTERTPADFENARLSLALVRAGDVKDEDLVAPSLVCIVRYLSFWDVWYRFRVFHIEFRDAKTGKMILHAGQYADNPFSSENIVLEKTFKEIYTKLFPDRPNPFSTKKESPAPQPR
jgi:hypothetical protein